MPKDNNGYNTIVVFINRFSKKAVSVLYTKTAIVIDLADLYVVHYYRYIGLPNSIVSNKGP